MILSAPSKLSFSIITKGSFRTSLLKKVDKEMYEAYHVHVDELQNYNTLSFSVLIYVINIGDLDGSHVVMLFSKWPKVINVLQKISLLGSVMCILFLTNLLKQAF